MSNVFEAPKSNLVEEAVSTGDYGSLEKAVQGDFEFSIGSVLKEAWQKTKGAKWVFHLGFLWYFLVVIALAVVMQVVMMTVIVQNLGPDLVPAFAIVEQVILNLVVMPMAMGLFIMGVRRSVNAPLESTTVFDYFPKAFKMLGTLILMYIMMAIGFVLLVIPGIYLMVAYMMAIPLVTEKNLGIWEAMEISRKSVTKCWFRMLFLGIAVAIIIVISTIPLGLGLIWTIPMMMIAYGIVYRNMFGVEAETAA